MRGRLASTLQTATCLFFSFGFHLRPVPRSRSGVPKRLVTKTRAWHARTHGSNYDSVRYDEITRVPGLPTLPREPGETRTANAQTENSKRWITRLVSR
jgi:hypothetical protein